MENVSSSSSSSTSPPPAAAMTQPTTTTTTTPSLTTTHFQTAIQTFLDETKPDLLTRHQIQQLHVEWEPHARESPAHQHDMEDEEQPTKEYLQRDHPKRRQQQHAHVVELDGTLRLSSEYIALFVRVSCRFLFDASTPAIVSRTAPNDTGGKTHEDDQTNDHTRPSHHDNSQIYREDLHVRIHAKASFLSLKEFKNLDARRYGENGNDADPKARKQGLSRKERATRLKLRSGMMQRLRSDPFVRKLLVEGGDGDGDGCNGHGNENGKKEKYGVEVEGQPLCEVRIQQIRNGGTTDGNDNDNPQTSSSVQELEERVDVHEPTLEGMRRALFSQWDDNLDVLEFLLHMPIFPRKVNVDGCVDSDGNGNESDSGSGSNGFVNWFYSAEGNGNNAMDGTSLGVNQQSAMNSLAKLGERAYLRLLEDAMFDACEKEGEDEILDDLTISGRTTSDDGDFDDEAYDNGGRSDGVLDWRGRDGHESHLGGKSDVNRCQKMRGKPLPNAKRAKPL